MLRFTFLLLPLGLAGCFDNISTEFPAELLPLEENEAEFPEGTEEDPFPEKLSLFDDLGSGFHRVHARGYIHASVDDVYTAMRLPEVTVDEAKVDKWKLVNGSDGVPECEELPAPIKYCYLLENEVDSIISVEFHVVWRFGTVPPQEDGDVTRRRGRWKKVWGSEVIELLDGSIDVYPVEGEDKVTAVEIIEHLDAFQNSRGNAIDFVNDYFDGIVDAANPEP